MVIKIGDSIPEECTPVGNVLFAMLDGTGGTLERTDELKGTLPLASRKNTYITNFEANSLQICEENREFAKSKSFLVVDIMELAAGCYIIAEQEHISQTLAFSAKFQTIQKLTRTKDGLIWAIYTAIETRQYNGEQITSGAIYLAYSSNKGISWQGHYRVNDIQGDCKEGCIVSDSDNNIHIIWGQNDIKNIDGWPDSAAINLLYRSYNKNLGFSGTRYITKTSKILGQSMAQDHWSIAVDKNNKIHIAWEGEGFEEPDEWGNFPISLEYVTVSYGLPGLQKTLKPGPYISVPCIQVDDNDIYHIIYRDDTTLYYYNSTPVTESIFPFTDSTNFALIPTIYGDDSLHYEPYLIANDGGTATYTPEMKEALRGESGWQKTILGGTSGTITDHYREVGTNNIVIIAPNHNLTDGEVIRVYWTGSIFRLYNNMFYIDVIDANTIILLNSGAYGVQPSVQNGIWVLGGTHVSVTRDSSGTIAVVYHLTKDPNTYVGDTYIMTGTPGNFTTKEKISPGTFWPTGINLDNEHTGDYMRGFMFTTSYYTAPNNVFKVCTSLREPN